MSAPADSITTSESERSRSRSSGAEGAREAARGRSTPERPGGAGLGKLLFFGLLALGVAFAGGLLPRLRVRSMVVSDTKELSEPTVAVVSPAPAKAAAPLLLSGERKPETEASIHARVNGYVRKWNVDLGAKVEAGQILAELDTPDTDRELSRARAELNQAEAARGMAESTAKRWKEMLSGKTVSAQEAEEKASDLELKKATVEAARANVQRLQEVAGFARIAAPFAGTITVRNIDVGELVTAGADQELFRLAQTDKLRVFVRVPQNYARNTKTGQSAEITLPEMKGRKFEAKIVRTSGALDAATRTLLTELEVDNSKGEILAGSYAQVRLADVKPEAALTLPSNTLLFRAEGTQVAIVEQGKIVLKHVTLGRDFGSSVEIQDGVTATDRVVTNPPDTLAEGAAVKVVEAK